MVGSVSTIGGSTFVSGLGSGLDTAALIEAGYSQRTQRADRIDIDISSNQEKVTAYEELRSLAQDLQSSVDALRRQYDVLGLTSNGFDSRAGTLSSSVSTTNPLDLISATIDDGAPQASYEIEVTQKAEADRVVSDGAAGTFADRTAALGFDGTFDLGLSGGATASIAVTATMSLNEIASAINNVSTTTNISADVIDTGAGSYQLLIRADETGQAITYSDTAGDDIFEEIGIHDGADAYVNQVSTAQSAIIEFEGVTVTSTDNTFDDVVDGISITTIRAEPGTILTLGIEADSAEAKTAILDFIDKYNALRDFVVTNEKVNSDGTLPEDSVLFSDNTMLGLDSAISSVFALNFTTDAGFETLGELGITLDSDKRLVLSNETELDNALINNFDSVRQLFETQVTADNDSFIIISNTSTLTDFSIALDVTHDGSEITGVSVGGDSSLFTFSGTSIIGAGGSIYEGITFAYAGTTSTTINVDFNQGLADLIYNHTEGYANVVGGDIQNQILSLTDLNVSLAEDASDIRDRADLWRDNEIQRIAAFEAEMALAQVLIDQIKAIVDAQNND